MGKQEHCAKFAFFFPVVFLQPVKNRQSGNELEMHLQGDLPHLR